MDDSPGVGTLRSRRLLAGLAVLAWAGLIAIGVRAFYLRETTPGERGTEVTQWPADSRLPRSTTAATLLMFLHPGCSCSRASVSELAQLMSATRARPRLVVVFVTDEPGGSLWDAVGEIAGAERILDRDAIEATRFGARTSGHVEVYDARGALAYAGGITGSRGHVGDNMGKRSIASVLDGFAPITAHYGVFGCGLLAQGGRP